ncbi:hypothetical protein AK830_g910 [Neonectria ditissima]|uniref:Clr5 domain-containing protein n=1 Tax=Neonectria ditissima TaxID=78410 RepID=A0A0P7BXN7_9HYPO|nr:hypothetical protein AK830_g910 [Neonectria ditissima]
MDSHSFFDTSPRFGWSPQNDFLHGGDFERPMDTPILRNPIPESPAMNHDRSHDDGPSTQPVSQPPPAPVASTVAQAVPTGPKRRSRYRQLNWNRQKARLKTVYLDENKSLAETMQIMKNEYSFDASVKLYKEKFKQWGWSKNLPVPIAEFIVGKAKERRRNRGEETVFTYGGRQWDQARAEHTLSRTTKPRLQSEHLDVKTPEGVLYNAPTPQVIILSSAGDSSATSGDDESEAQTDKASIIEIASDSEADNETTLPLSWNGYTRTQLLSMRQEGSDLVQRGNPEAARELLNEALEGFTHLQGVTNEETKKIAYELADLYVQLGSHREADLVLEQITQSHIEKLGVKDKKTQQHVLHTVELLNGWNRPQDALGLLSLAQETTKTNPPPRSRNSRKRARRRKNRGSARVGSDSPIPEDASQSYIDYRINEARPHVASKVAAVESLLVALINHCESKQKQLPIQNLRARAELLSLYQKLDAIDAHTSAFEDAHNALNRIWRSYQWHEERFQCVEMMEAYMQVVANMLKGGYEAVAKAQFRQVADKAESLFMFNDERAVWINITIGLVYQTHMTWDDAQEWFSRALAGAMANTQWNAEDGIVRALDNARDKHHFSYISDEGRPYRTIFGISGITIRPGRLHLE